MDPIHRTTHRSSRDMQSLWIIVVLRGASICVKSQIVCYWVVINVGLVLMNASFYVICSAVLRHHSLNFIIHIKNLYYNDTSCCVREYVPLCFSQDLKRRVIPVWWEDWLLWLCWQLCS